MELYEISDRKCVSYKFKEGNYLKLDGEYNETSIDRTSVNRSTG